MSIKANEGLVKANLAILHFDVVDYHNLILYSYN